MFPTEVRALGVGFSYALANALFGGTAEYIALFLKSINIESAFFWYVTVLSAVTLAVAMTMPDPRREKYLSR
jgi:MHS family alpha-ketoglutarate permease-like MFS transporter